MFKFYLQVFTGVLCGFLCHAADVSSVSDFVPNPINHVRICGPNRFCYPYRAKIVLKWGEFL